MGAGRPPLFGRLVVIGYVIAVVVCGGLHLAGAPVVLVVVGAMPIPAILISFRMNRIADRWPWLLVVVGIGLLTTVNIRWYVVTEVARTAFAVDDPPQRLMQMGGYVALLAASVLVVLRHAPNDGGRVIDAALMGTGAAAPIWEFALRPRMLAAGSSTITQTLILVETLALLATAGSLLRISRTATAARMTLSLFFASLAATVVGLMLAIALAPPTGTTGGPASPLVILCWIIGYLSLTAAALHPSSALLTQPTGWRRDELSTVRLTQLGAVLLVAPVVGGVPQLVGGRPDGLLLSVGPLLSVPLVLTRIAQLLAQRARDQHLLTHQATHDELTGLANRRHLFQLAAAATDGLRAGRLQQLAILYCDLDGFKPINDQLGHDAGDHVLRVVSERVRSVLRAGDTVGRLGGDEFLALCPDAGQGDAVALRQRIEDALAAPVLWRGVELRVGMTIGIALTGGAVDVSADALVADADADMYQRKRQRRAAAPVPPFTTVTA